MSTDVYKIIISQIDGHVDLLMKFSLGLCGGIIAFFSQSMLQNLKDGKKNPIEITSYPLVAAFGLSILSIVMGYLTKSALIAATPVLSRINFDRDELLTYYLAKNDLNYISTLSVIQLSYLLASFIVAGFAVYKNCSLYSFLPKRNSN